MSSAICFNLDQSKILSSGNGLNKKYLCYLENCFDCSVRKTHEAYVHEKICKDRDASMTVGLLVVLGFNATLTAKWLVVLGFNATLTANWFVGCIGV